MADFTQKFPQKLLTEILEHAPSPDVLGFMQANRAFRDVILSSPLIQHKIELYATGLEYNATAGTILAESQSALLRYCSNLNSLHPVETRKVEFRQTRDESMIVSSGGVFSIAEDTVQLFQLGSALRRIPHKEWEIPLPAVNVITHHHENSF